MSEKPVDNDNVISLEAARQTDAEATARKGIFDQLTIGDSGPHRNLANLITVIRLDPALERLCAYNDFTHANCLLRPPPLLTAESLRQPGPYPRPWTRADVSHVRSHIQRAWIRLAGKDDTEDAMEAVGATRRFHPPRDWLATLVWDGKPRLDTWLMHTLGAADTPYHRAIAACFLIAAVRRVRQPGCKFDHMLVLQGLQNIGKSTVFRILFTEHWFSDSLPAAIESRDAAIGVQGVWCLEFAELEQLIRTESEPMKAFISRAVDRYKPMYGRDYIERPRQCVLVGSTNRDDWLRDETGNRRFWPALCTAINLEWLTVCREQLWAEAAHREAKGESHWLQSQPIIAEASRQQADRMQEDVWTDRIMSIVAYRKETTTAEILTDDLQIPLERQTRREEMRIGKILLSAGWEQKWKNRTKNGKPARTRVWFAPGTLQNSDA